MSMTMFSIKLVFIFWLINTLKYQVMVDLHSIDAMQNLFVFDSAVAQNYHI